MGSVFLPTPLSPAVGFRRNAYRLACLHLFRTSKGLAIRICRPALAPVPNRCLDTSGDPKTDPDRSGGLSAAGAVTLRLKRPREAASCPLMPSTPGFITPATDESSCGFNGWRDCHPKVLVRPSSTATVLPSRRVRFGFRFPVSAGDPGRRSVSALDELRMRRGAESGKGASVDLSTFGRKASGQGWISQRLVAMRETKLRLFASAA